MNTPKSIPAYSIESLRSTDSEAKDFDFFRFEYLTDDIPRLRTPHRHHFYTFLLVTEGAGSHSIDFLAHELKPGRLFLIAPGQVHAWHEVRDIRGFVLLFNDNLMALSKGKKMMAAWPLFRVHHPNLLDLDGRERKIWEETLLRIEEEVAHKDEFTRDAIFFYISELLVRASREMRARNSDIMTAQQDILFSFQELIELHYLHLRAPRDYAAMLHITPNYLNTFCRKKSGRSAGELIRQRVILEAKRLLAHTQLSVSEIAFRLNFEDNSYFGRFFRKYTHTTPAQFRSSQEV